MCHALHQREFQIRDHLQTFSPGEGTPRGNRGERFFRKSMDIAIPKLDITHAGDSSSELAHAGFRRWIAPPPDIKTGCLIERKNPQQPLSPFMGIHPIETLNLGRDHQVADTLPLADPVEG